MEPTTPTSQYKAIAQLYFDGLAKKDLSAVPWAEDVAFRAPINPKGGAEVPILGKDHILAFLNPLLAALGKVEVLRHYLSEDGVCTRANVWLATDPPRVLRVVDCFRISKARLSNRKTIMIRARHSGTESIRKDNKTLPPRLLRIVATTPRAQGLT